MSGQCNSPCATINERRRGMMNKFQGTIDCYDNQPFKDRMNCPPPVLREYPTLVERNQLVACYPVCAPVPCDPCGSPCPSPCPPPCQPCSPCPPPACYPCPPPACIPCPSPYDQGNGGSPRELQHDSRELRGGVLYTGCECVKRNGLQHDCKRSECQGSPACLVKPWPDCKPSGGSGMKSAPPRVSNYPAIEEKCNPAPPRPRGPPAPDREHRAGMPCLQCEPPIKYTKPDYTPRCPPPDCPKPKLSHHPTSRIPPSYTELKGGHLLSRCDCIRRNGLQDDCQLRDCGIPECLFKPEPECIPSGGRGPQGGDHSANGLGPGRSNGNGGSRFQSCPPPMCPLPCPPPCPLPCPPPVPRPGLQNCLVQCYPCPPPCRWC